jgi:hypothetical protein
LALVGIDWRRLHSASNSDTDLAITKAYAELATGRSIRAGANVCLRQVELAQALAVVKHSDRNDLPMHDRKAQRQAATRHRPTRDQRPPDPATPPTRVARTAEQNRRQPSITHPLHGSETQLRRSDLTHPRAHHPQAVRNEHVRPAKRTASPSNRQRMGSRPGRRAHNPGAYPSSSCDAGSPLGGIDRDLGQQLKRRIRRRGVVVDSLAGTRPFYIHGHPGNEAHAHEHNPCRVHRIWMFPFVEKLMLGANLR